MKTENFIIPDMETRQKIISALVTDKNTLQAAKTAIALLEFSQKIQTSFDKHFARYGLTQSRFLILAALRSEEKRCWSSVELSDLLAVKPPTMTGILDGLINSGLIEKTVDSKDRRKSNINITAQGRKKIDSVIADHMTRITSSFAALAQQQQEMALLQGKVNDSLSKLLENR